MAFEQFKRVAANTLQMTYDGSIIFGDGKIQTTAYRAYSGQFSDFTNQTTADATASKAITFNTTDVSDGVSIVSSSRITYANAGTYSLEFDIQFENAAATRSDVYVWLAKNGTAVAGSTALGSIPAIQTAVNGRVYLSGTHLVTAAAGDYFELIWGTSSISVQLSTFAAGVSPTRPTAASASVFTVLVK
jgi:hypothetical protein